MFAKRLSVALVMVHCAAEASDLGCVFPDETNLLQHSVSVQEDGGAAHTLIQAALCSKMGYRENRFEILEFGLTGLESNMYTFTTACGYDIDLTGWSQTAFCHEGFARTSAGNATAVVRGLKAGSSYDFKIWQIAFSFSGNNPLAVNGVSFGETATTTTMDPSATGSATADSAGKITFTFTRESSHVSLAAIAISEVPRLLTPSAVDDPHLVNIQGQRFDVLQPRTHTLLQIPRGAKTADTLLRIDGTMTKFESDCTELYIRTLHATGRWANETTGGPLTFHAGDDGLGRLGSSGVMLATGDVRAVTEIRRASLRGVKWIQDGPREKGIISRVAINFGPTRAVIDWRKKQGKGMNIVHLNLRVLRLGLANKSIGGLLGLDDHSFASSMPEECQATSAAAIALTRSAVETPFQEAQAMAEASLY